MIILTVIKNIFMGAAASGEMTIMKSNGLRTAQDIVFTVHENDTYNLFRQWGLFI